MHHLFGISWLYVTIGRQKKCLWYPYHGEHTDEKIRGATQPCKEAKKNIVMGHLIILIS